jgi:hypothetical protein
LTKAHFFDIVTDQFVLSASVYGTIFALLTLSARAVEATECRLANQGLAAMEKAGRSES